MTSISLPPTGRQAESAPDLDLGDRRDRQFAGLVVLDQLYRRFGGRLTPTLPLRDTLERRVDAVGPTLRAAARLLLDTVDDPEGRR
jgi:hypothetical protein